MLRLEHKSLAFPVFCGTAYKDRIILAGGGGGAKFGVPNMLLVLDGTDSRELYSENTHDNLIERLFAHARGETLLAVSEHKVFVYRVLPTGGLTLLTSTDLAQRTSEDSLLIDGDGKGIFAIENRSHLFCLLLYKDRLERRFELDLGHRVMALKHLKKKKALWLMLQDKVMLFSLRTRKFVQSLPFSTRIDEKVIVFASRGDEGLAVLKSSAESCRLSLFCYEAEKEGYRLSHERQVLKVSASSAAWLDRWIVIGDVEGAVHILGCPPGLPAWHLHTLKVHELPATALVLLPALSLGRRERFVLWSFGLDYQAQAFEVIPADIASPNQRRIWAFLAALLVLMLSLAAKYLQRSRRLLPTTDSTLIASLNATEISSPL